MAKKVTTITMDEELWERGEKQKGNHALSTILSTLYEAWLDGRIKNIHIPMEPIQIEESQNAT